MAPSLESSSHSIEDRGVSHFLLVANRKFGIIPKNIDRWERFQLFPRCTPNKGLVENGSLGKKDFQNV